MHFDVISGNSQLVTQSLLCMARNDNLSHSPPNCRSDSGRRASWEKYTTRTIETTTQLKVH